MSDINPVEFGRLVGLVEALRGDFAKFETSYVGKQDALEARVGVLETKRAEGTWKDKVLDKALWGLLLAGLGVLAKFLGG